MVMRRLGSTTRHRLIRSLAARMDGHLEGTKESHAKGWGGGGWGGDTVRHGVLALLVRLRYQTPDSEQASGVPGSDTSSHHGDGKS